MAVGETAGEARAPRRVVSTATKRPEKAAPPATSDEPTEEVAPLLKEADADFEKLLAEEEAIERSVREHHETPHFRPGDGD
jgi:hypothetical protein